MIKKAPNGSPGTSNQPGKRGRPRKYDPDTALGNAQSLFWQKGYAATSLDNLAEVTGMNRPSLYGAFGNKKSIYLKSLAKFQRDLEEKLQPLTSLNAPLSEILQRHFEILIEIYTESQNTQLGCLFLSTATTEAANDEEIKTLLNTTLHQIDNSFEQHVKRAIERQELPSDTDPYTLATLLASLSHSLSIRARSGASGSELRAISKRTIQLVLS